MLSKCTNILPEDLHFHNWHGFITVKQREFYIRVRYFENGVSVPNILPLAPTMSLQRANKSDSVPGDKTAVDMVLMLSEEDEDTMDEEEEKLAQKRRKKQNNDEGARSRILEKTVHKGLLWCENELALLLKDHREIVRQRMKQSTNLQGFLVELSHLAETLLNENQQLEKTPQLQDLPPPEYYSHLLVELQAIGWAKVVSIDASLTTLTLAVADSRERSHSLRIELSSDYPRKAPVFHAELPGPTFVVPWSSESTLVKACDMFKKELRKFELFWDVMDDFDKHTCVLEGGDMNPYANPTRRISIGRNASLVLNLNWEHPFAPCPCTFMGPTSVVSSLRDKLNHRLHMWDPMEFPRLNLQKILDLKFLEKSEVNLQAINEECGICYSHRALSGDAPEVVCDFEKCNKTFHQACILEWLLAVPNSRRSYNTVFGTCPYCSSALTVSTAAGNDC